MLRLALTLALLPTITPAFAHAQQPTPTSMGTVPTRDALVTGGLEVQGSTARLLTNASVTAYDHSAAISLARGGDVLVCATSQFHLLHSGTEESLLFGLDRGAIELHTNSAPQDVILTPDIRFTLEHAGRYDLRLRVTPNGDTCVDNAGASAPVLTLTDPYTSAQYRLIPGQHVMFEHGSLHEVVDNERSPCGCPAPAPAQQIASGTPTNPNAPATPTTAAAEHPFPAAASVGLAPTPAPPPAANTTPSGEAHTQVSTVFSYDASHPNTPPPSTLPPPATYTRANRLNRQPDRHRHKHQRRLRRQPRPARTTWSTRSATSSIKSFTQRAECRIRSRHISSARVRGPFGLLLAMQVEPERSLHAPLHRKIDPQPGNLFEIPRVTQRPNINRPHPCIGDQLSHDRLRLDIIAAVHHVEGRIAHQRRANRVERLHDACSARPARDREPRTPGLRHDHAQLAVQRIHRIDHHLPVER